MISLPYSVYIQEIVDFLKTVTIKYSPFVEQIDRYLYRYKGIPIPKEDEKRKYYLNLTGQYHESDTVMKIWSIDTEQEISFDKDILKLHPKTLGLYSVTSEEYKTLCYKYPTQVDLIKNILYPACNGDIDTLIEASNLSLVGYDISFLHINERESLIVSLIEFLTYVEDRWFFQNYYFEDMFYPTFFSILWPNIALVLLTKRILNIKTNNAHPFHIWEHLSSNGLSDYKSILTNTQALWLYRNIEYIIRNRGKMTNLYKLVENLLKYHYISLVSKQLYQGIEPIPSVKCMTSPEIVDQKIVNYRRTPALTDTFIPLIDFQYRLYNEKLEVKNDIDYLEDLTAKLGINKYNILQTKFLELQKDPIFITHLELLGEFILDTIIYKYSHGKIQYKFTFNDPLTDIRLELSIDELLTFAHYAIHKSFNSHPVTLPKTYVTRIPYHGQKPDLINLPETINIKNVLFKIKNELELDTIVNSIYWNDDVIKTHEQFGELIGRQFNAMMTHIYSVQTTSSTSYQMSIATLYNELIAQEVIQLNLSNTTNYVDWFKLNENLYNVYTAYDELADNAVMLWNNLVDRILDTLYPANINQYLQFAGHIEESNVIYEGLKNLLIQLSSINVTYLDTTRAVRYYLFLRFLTIAFGVSEHKDKLYLNWFSSKKFQYISSIYTLNDLIRYLSYSYRKPYLLDYGDIDISYKLHYNTDSYVSVPLYTTFSQTTCNFDHSQTLPINLGMSIDMSHYTEG
jgi:hypothetical protein